jgi:hypothetical protein
VADTDVDTDSLIEKTEKEGDQIEEHDSSMTFSFAKVWATDKGEMEEMTDAVPDANGQGDSWAQTLERIASERQKVQAKEVTGRGAKRKAAAVFPTVFTTILDFVRLNLIPLLYPSSINSKIFRLPQRNPN